MPGLREMHVNLKKQNELLPLVASGVTSIHGMWRTTGAQLWPGFPDQLTVREEIE
jgi:hypothetical protein